MASRITKGQVTTTKTETCEGLEWKSSESSDIRVTDERASHYWHSWPSAGQTENHRERHSRTSCFVCFTVCAKGQVSRFNLNYKN